MPTPLSRDCLQAYLVLDVIADMEQCRAFHCQMKAFMLPFHSLLKSAMQVTLVDLTCNAGLSSIELPLPLWHDSGPAELLNRVDGGTGI